MIRDALHELALSARTELAATGAALAASAVLSLSLAGLAAGLAHTITRGA